MRGCGRRPGRQGLPLPPPPAACGPLLTLLHFNRPCAPSRHAGAVATGAVLLGGLVAFKNGKSALAQQFMRARVITQGITVAIMVGSGG